VIFSVTPFKSARLMLALSHKSPTLDVYDHNKSYATAAVSHSDPRSPKQRFGPERE
jgi:hypothetical protein